MDHVIPKCTAAPTIIRRDSRRRFVVIDHEAIDDPNLSARALGFLAYLLGKPDNWETRTADLMKRFGCGKDYVYAALGEIQKAGYAERRPIRDPQGRITRWELVIYETAQSVSPTCPDPGLPELAKPDQVIPPQLKKEEALSIETTRAFVQPDAAPSPEWTDELKGVKATLDEFRAPAGFYDLAFWAKIAAAYGPLPDVYYIDELRKYLLWWHAQPPSRRRKAVTRSFTTWLRTEEARAAARAERARERTVTNGYHQARR